MRIKTCPVKIKAAGTNEGTDEGVFEALVAVFNNIDSVGDKIVPGAFEETLKAWQDSGDPIPVYWSHRMDDPDMNIGEVLDAKETDQGLWVKAQLDLESPKGQTTYRLLKGRRVTQFSFAYDVEDYAIISEKDAPTFFELRKLKLHEVGPTPIGANQETDLLAVKTAGGRLVQVTIAGGTLEDSDSIRKALDVALASPGDHAKSGRVLSGKNEDALRSALEKINGGAAEIKTLLAALDDEKAKPAAPAPSEEPDGAKDDRPAQPGPASLRLHADLASLEAEVFELTG
jgi:hypothetical protein